MGSTKTFGIYGASNEIISLTPKRLLKTCVLEKCYLSNEQILCRVFSLVIEQDERQGTVYMGTEGIPTIIGQLVRSILQEQRGLKNRNYKKRRLASLRKKWLSPILSPNTDYDRYRIFFST